jgi:RNA polymerase sigma factor (sigma-70 family)
MLDLIRKEWRAKSSATHDEFLDKIKARVSQVIDDTLQNGDKPINAKNLLSITTTSYMVSLENVMEAYGDNVPDKSSSIDKTYELNDEYSSLNKLILELPKEDVKFIDLFYRKGLSQKEISVELDLSEATISRMHHKVISNLKNKIGNEFG